MCGRAAVFDTVCRVEIVVDGVVGICDDDVFRDTDRLNVAGTDLFVGGAHIPAGLMPAPSDSALAEMSSVCGPVLRGISTA